MIYDMASGKYKYLDKRTQPDNVLTDKAFKIASNPKYDGSQGRLASMVHKVFDKKPKGRGIKSMSNQQLADQIHKPINKKLKKSKSFFFN